MTIKEMREQTYLSQNHFAKILDIPVSNIARWEQGQSSPPDYVVELIRFKLTTIGLMKEKR